MREMRRGLGLAVGLAVRLELGGKGGAPAPAHGQMPMGGGAPAAADHPQKVVE